MSDHIKALLVLRIKMALTWPIELLLIMSGHLQWPSQMGVNLTTLAEGKIGYFPISKIQSLKEISIITGIIAILT